MRKARWLTRRRVRKSAVNSFAVLAAAGTAAALVTVGTVAPPAASAGVARQAAPPVPVLDWHSCQGAFQCATATVPLDYRRPDGATISIAVIRHLATDSKGRLGSLFFNSGGPAEQIGPFLDSYPAIPAELRARFDIVSFDPRGFDPSSAISCFPSL